MHVRLQLRVPMLLVFSILAAGQAWANVISNGNFATGDLTGWLPFVTSNGTTGVGLPTVVSFDTTGGGAGNSAAFNVGEALPATGEQGGGISQTIDITIAGLYDFSAAIASQAEDTGGNTDAGLFSILINGTTEGSLSLGSLPNPSQIKRDTLTGSIFLTPSTYTFSFEIERGFTSDRVNSPTEYVTDITLTQASDVPEPGLWLPTALSLAGLVFWQRRKGFGAR